MYFTRFETKFINHLAFGMWPDLFAYTYETNEKLIDSFLDNLDKVPERSILLINHILNAHQIWNARILGNKHLKFGKKNKPESWKELNQMNNKNSQEILKNYNLNQTIPYQNSKGIIFNNTIKDVLFHVINHSTYHRGQIAILFRKAGLEPIPTDYIFYKRSLDL